MFSSPEHLADHIPSYTFVTLKTQAAKEMCDRWKADLLIAMEEFATEHRFYTTIPSDKKNFSLYANLAAAKSKAEFAIGLTAASVSIFDSFVYEIAENYREYFRDTPKNEPFDVDADYVSIKNILEEFYKVTQGVIVTNMFPLDLEGTIGFVVIPTL